MKLNVLGKYLRCVFRVTECVYGISVYRFCSWANAKSMNSVDCQTLPNKSNRIENKNEQRKQKVQ